MDLGIPIAFILSSGGAHPLMWISTYSDTASWEHLPGSLCVRLWLLPLGSCTLFARAQSQEPTVPPAHRI